jgi:GSCFA family/Polysaccharide biosynthesis enzyme WcbI
MKIAIVSNCQGESIASCLADINTNLSVEFILITELWNGNRDLNQILRHYDLVLAQSTLAEHVSPEYRPKVRYFPNIVFPAFHPDITYLRGKKKGSADIETIYSHMAHYNSALVVYGFIRGMSSDQIFDLFNEKTFLKLGYLDGWNNSKAMLLEEGKKIGFPLTDLLEKWKTTGCFMYSFNHPTMHIAADIAMTIARGLGIEIQNFNSARYLNDPLKAMPVWPIYPAIAKHYGLDGDYAFTRYSPLGTMQLKLYIESSINHYESYELASIEPLNFDLNDFDRALRVTQKPEISSKSSQLTVASATANKDFSNPYRNLPDIQFWKKSVAAVSPADLDPVHLPRFRIGKDLKISTAGSCFAQHIARTLSNSGFNYFVSELPPVGISKQIAKESNYGVFSARYGNIYTARQFAQLFKRATNKFVPVDNYWLRKDGRYVDPFRPQIEPNGYETIAMLEASRELHFDAVRELFTKTDVFVFTLGLTEGWRSKIDGAVFPIAPGVSGGEMDSCRYEFINFSAQDVVSDMNEALMLLRQINSDCKVILTVSPVPLIATYEPQHALVATTYSKSVLRVAADEIKRSNDFVDYFPSFEIITGAYNKGAYFEDDLRSVKPEGVAHVMRLFLKHYTVATENDQNKAVFVPQIKNIFDIVCDEEAIAII